MAGTVLADTNVFARTFDQQQWAHAFGLQLIPRACCRRTQQDAYTLHQWWFGTPPPTAEQLRDRQGRRRAPDGRPAARGAEPHAADTSATACTRSRRRANGRHDASERSCTYGDHGFWTGDRLRRARQRRHPLLGPEGRRPGRDRHRRQGHVPARRRRHALPPGPVADDAGEAVRPGRAPSRSTRRTRSRPTSCRRRVPRAGRRTARPTK